MTIETTHQLIYELIRKANANGLDVGRTKLQKLCYFIQDLGEGTRYRFQLRHYGPYSEELSKEVDALASLGFIRMEPDQAGYGYHIHPGNRSPERSTEYGRYETIVDNVVRMLAPLETNKLEVMATLKFVGDLLSKKGRTAEREELLGLVKQLKPGYTRDFIQGCFDLLQENLKRLTA